MQPPHSDVRGKPSRVNTIGPCFQILAFVSQSCLRRPTPSMTSHTHTQPAQEKHSFSCPKVCWGNLRKSCSIRLSESIQNGLEYNHQPKNFPSLFTWPSYLFLSIFLVKKLDLSARWSRTFPIIDPYLGIKLYIFLDFKTDHEMYAT